MGIAAAIVYVTLGRRRIDYRYILLGAVLPDGLDAVGGIFLFDGPSGRWIAHSLLALILVTVLIVGLFKGERRLALFGIAVGWLTHLVGDGMWQSPETFFWPGFGTGFSETPVEPYSWDLFLDASAHLATWTGEVVGALILFWFWVAFRLGHDGRFGRFATDGYLRP